MITEDERIESFLKGIVPPDYRSDEHRRRLLSQVLARLQTRNASRGIHAWRKPIALLLGLLCAGAAATELVLRVRHYYFEGRSSDGSYHFATEPETLSGSADGPNGTSQSVSVVRSTVSVVGSDGVELDAAAIEQKRKDLEEIDALRHRDARELVGVTDTEVNGKFLSRAFVFKYVLADGRVETMGEAGFDPARLTSPAQMERDQQEIADLRKRGEREISCVIDTDLDGQVQRTLICRYVLSDGSEQRIGESDPDLPAPSRMLTPEQLRELGRLVSLNKGKFLGTVSTQMFGKTFIFQGYSFELSDGTVVTRSEGKPEGMKRELTDADWKELQALMVAHRGETLGTYDETLWGKLFKFTRVKYVLSDGTEIIQSRGQPSSEK